MYSLKKYISLIDANIIYSSWLFSIPESQFQNRKHFHNHFRIILYLLIKNFNFILQIPFFNCHDKINLSPYLLDSLFYLLYFRDRNRSCTKKKIFKSHQNFEICLLKKIFVVYKSLNFNVNICTQTTT